MIDLPLSQRGQILTSFVILVPVLLALLTTLFLTGRYLSYRTKNLKLCRSELNSVQENMKTSLKDLKALNPEAQRLRKLAKWAKNTAKYGAHLNAAIGVTGAAAYAYIRSAQALLRSKQFLIIRNAHNYARAKTNKLNIALGSKNQSRYSIGESLQVYPKPLHSITPSYYEKPAFSRLQKIKIKWPESLIPSNSKTFSIVKALSSLSVENSCSATLQKLGTQWETVIE